MLPNVMEGPLSLISVGELLQSITAIIRIVA